MSVPESNKVMPTKTAEKTNATPLVELKNGKVVFRQKCISFEKFSETMQEIVKFRDLLQERIPRQEPPLASFPEEHLPLIAKLAHESDRTLSTLSKHIQNELLPVQDDGEECPAPAQAILPISVVETAITSILIRNNYGLDMSSGVARPPASLCVWRWEVKKEYWDWLPKAAQAKAESRLAERVQAKKELVDLVQALSLEERNALLPVRGASRTKGCDEVSSPPVDLTKDDSQMDPQPTSQRTVVDDLGPNNVNAETPVPKTSVGRPRKAPDPEKLSKEKEKAEQKAAKADQERKAREAEERSRSVMANFFSKPKIPKPKPSNAVASSSGPSNFEKTFKPFVLKKDAVSAPINWFTFERQKSKGKGPANRFAGDVIIVDDDITVEVPQTQPNDMNMDVIYDVSTLSVQERLQTAIASLPKPILPVMRPPRTRQYKLASPISVRTLVSELTEAEIAGSTSRVRKLLAKLSSRSLIPAKVLIFHHDLRPGYFGTWTRNSTAIGPRTPFARDLLSLDYGYDSGEEWEEDDLNGENVDDDDEEPDVEEEADSDLDSWLVDDDEVVEVQGEGIEPDPLLFLSVPAPPPKRKSAEKPKELKLEKRRKVVVPLVPFKKGPVWENSIGDGQYDAFRPFKIQLFNDTPYPINPFTFVSNVSDRPPTHSRALKDSGQTDFMVPPLPDRLSVPNTSAPTTVPANAHAAKRSQIIPKTNFPEALIPSLLQKITSLATGNINFLVESVYQELREHKVKKNAIEMKIRELGEKDKQKKIWVVKNDVAVTQEPPT